MRCFILFFFLLSVVYCKAQPYPGDIYLTDTSFYKNSLPKKIVFSDSLGNKLGKSLYTYYSNDTIETCLFKGKKETVLKNYDHYGNSVEVITKSRGYTTLFKSEYEYDDLGRVTRLRYYYDGLSGELRLRESMGFHYTGALMTRKDFYVGNDEFDSWIAYEYNDSGEYIAYEKFWKDSSLVGARKKIRLLPDGEVKDYVLRYQYRYGIIKTINACPFGIPHSETYASRKKITFQFEEQKLKSYTFYNHRGDDIGGLQDQDEGQVFLVDSLTENHPIVKEFWDVMKSNPPIDEKKYENDPWFVPSGIH